MKSRLSEKVEVRESGIDRKGMFAKEHIFKGEIVYIKGGHIIRKNEIFTSGMINSYLPISDDYYMSSLNADVWSFSLIKEFSRMTLSMERSSEIR